MKKTFFLRTQKTGDDNEVYRLPALQKVFVEATGWKENLTALEMDYDFKNKQVTIREIRNDRVN